MPPKLSQWSIFARPVYEPCYDLSSILPRIWEQMDHYKRYPIANRGIAAFFGQEVCQHLNHYRSKIVKNADMSILFEYWEDIFESFVLSTEYIHPQNKDFICATFANAFGGINNYKNSQNISTNEIHDALIKSAEHFSLWGTGCCGEISSLVFLLLANAGIRPIEIVSLGGRDSTLSAHCLVLIGREPHSSLDTIYDSDTLVVDYWSGCVGEARTLFDSNGPLHAFKSRPVRKEAGVTSNAIIPQFIPPNEADVVNAHHMIEELYYRFTLSQLRKCKKNIEQATDPESCLLAPKYESVVSAYDFLAEESSYCIANDPYDNQREGNINHLMFEPSTRVQLT